MCEDQKSLTSVNAMEWSTMMWDDDGGSRNLRAFSKVTFYRGVFARGGRRKQNKAKQSQPKQNKAKKGEEGIDGLRVGRVCMCAPVNFGERRAGSSLGTHRKSRVLPCR